MRRLHLVLISSALIIAFTVWATYPAKPKSHGDPSTYRYMHCPKCMRESLYPPIKAEIPCPQCDKALVGTAESVNKNGTPVNPYSTMILLISIEAIAVMAIVWWTKRKRIENPEESYLYINCEKCGQKIRYHEHQVGRPAMCRRCKFAFVYPKASEEVY